MTPPSTSDDTRRRELVRRFGQALEAVIRAIRAELAAGRLPPHRRNEPTLSYRNNGMPSLTDGSSWNGSGPLQYDELLEPQPNPFGPNFNRKLGDGRFPEVEQWITFAYANPDCAIFALPRQQGDRTQPSDLERVMLEIQLTHAANQYFRRYGDSEIDDRKLKALLTPIIRGFFDERLDVATLIPIALVKFDFDRLRLARDVYIIRMNDTLHKKRWAVKAYGASGHECVVAAATHAFVVTGWQWPNRPWLQMLDNLGAPTPALRELIEELFAALRIVTGVSTGYAQELRLARGWTHLTTDDTPDVHAVGARRYPESFDDFGWMREDLPVITKAQMRMAATALAQIRANRSERLQLALRRMNTAMLRSDAADAILDATIALEILLSDGDTQAIGYKLRLRAGALSNLAIPGSANTVSAAIKGIYEARSRIVHGTRRRKTNDTGVEKEASESALKMLRNILKVVLERPRYLDPLKIDAELLLS